jgi:hypothetical protein
MNTEFRILNENTFNLKGGKLYTMLLRDNGIFGVEVVDREKTYGRKMTENLKQAEFLFDSISDRLIKYKTFTDAVSAIERCFGLDSLNKTLFTLIMDDKIGSQADIVAMKGKFKFVTLPKFGKDDSLIVNIFEKRTDKKPYGVLIGTVKGDDFKFELI